MGSFTELVLAFTFAPDSPQEALTAFASWRTGEDAPLLPLLDDSVSLDERMEIAEEVEMELIDSPDAEASVRGLPLIRRAVAWHALLDWPGNAYFPGTPATALRWDQHARHWTLTTRAVPKMALEPVQALISALGEFATEGSADHPQFVGYINDEDPDPPVLIYSCGRAPFRFRTG